jgi:hypothetical protein
MYKYALTVSDQLQLSAMKLFVQEEPQVTPIQGAKVIPAYEVADLM